MSGIQGFFLMATSHEKNTLDLDKIAEEFLQKIPVSERTIISRDIRFEEN